MQGGELGGAEGGGAWSCAEEGGEGGGEGVDFGVVGVDYGGEGGGLLGGRWWVGFRGHGFCLPWLGGRVVGLGGHWERRCGKEKGWVDVVEDDEGVVVDVRLCECWTIWTSDLWWRSRRRSRSEVVYVQRNARQGIDGRASRKIKVEI